MSHAHSTTKRRTFKHLTAYQRGQIEAMLRLGVPKVKIAKDLGIARSTLYAEIKRGTVTQKRSDWTYYEQYFAQSGQIRYERNREKSGKPSKFTISSCTCARMKPRRPISSSIRSWDSCAPSWMLWMRRTASTIARDVPSSTLSMGRRTPWARRQRSGRSSARRIPTSSMAPMPSHRSMCTISMRGEPCRPRYRRNTSAVGSTAIWSSTTTRRIRARTTSSRRTTARRGA